ncbi:MAG: DNA methyltransferase [Acidimicrobiales bacterium]
MAPLSSQQTAVAGAVRAAVTGALERDGVALLPPLDAGQTLALCAAAGIQARCTLLDPWYNKGAGGVRDDYGAFVGGLLEGAAALSDHVYLWGFPEIVAGLVGHLPSGLSLVAWLTWYYKNNPSVIRGWRSAQMTCLHLSRPGAPLHPEHFLNQAQLDKLAAGKLRYLPGPPSVLEGHPDVIEESLLVGFVGRAEQTGHPAQKPRAVIDKLLLMVLEGPEVVVDPMCGSGTTGASALALGHRAVLADHSPEFTALTARRLGIEPVELPAGSFGLLGGPGPDGPGTAPAGGGAGGSGRGSRAGPGSIAPETPGRLPSGLTG